MPITRKKIIESIHAGARAANEKYTEWSKGLWLYDSGVESLLVCEIAEQLYQSRVIQNVFGWSYLSERS